MPLRIADLTPTERRALVKALNERIVTLEERINYRRARRLAEPGEPDLAVLRVMLASLG